jgi:hypothetical protein
MGRGGGQRKRVRERNEPNDNECLVITRCRKPLIKTNEGNARANYVYLVEESFRLITPIYL